METLYKIIIRNGSVDDYLSFSIIDHFPGCDDQQSGGRLNKHQ